MKMSILFFRSGTSSFMAMGNLGILSPIEKAQMDNTPKRTALSTPHPATSNASFSSLAARMGLKTSIFSDMTVGVKVIQVIIVQLVQHSG